MSNSRYLRNNETISGHLNDELVMMDISKGKYYSLNPVATQIWDMLGVPLTLDELCERLIDEYDVDNVQCRTEVEAHLKEMQKLDLVAKKPSDSLHLKDSAL